MEKQRFPGRAVRRWNAGEVARVNRRFRWAVVGGFVAASILVSLLVPLLPDMGGSPGDAPVQRSTPSPLTRDDEIGLNETAWQTADCVTPEEWVGEDPPLSAVVRGVHDRILLRVDFGDAWESALAGEVWVVLLCAEAAEPVE